MKAGLTFLGLILLFTGFVQPGPKVKLSIFIKGKLIATYYNDWHRHKLSTPIEWYNDGKFISLYDSAVYEIGSQSKYSPLQNWK